MYGCPNINCPKKYITTITELCDEIDSLQKMLEIVLKSTYIYY